MNRAPIIPNILFFAQIVQLVKSCVCLGMISIEIFPWVPIKPRNNSYIGAHENESEKQLSYII